MVYIILCKWWTLYLNLAYRTGSLILSGQSPGINHTHLHEEAFNDAHSTFFHLWDLLYTSYCLNVSSWDDHIKRNSSLSVVCVCLSVCWFMSISPYVFRLSVHLLSFYLTFCLFVVCWFVSSGCLLHRHKNVWFTVVLVSWSVYFFQQCWNVMWKSWL